MKLKYFFLFFSVSLFSQSQKIDVKYYYEKVIDGFEIMVDNNEYCDVTVVLRLNHKNVTVSSKQKNSFLIPARHMLSYLS
jgi:hypothetical protein